MYETMEAFKMAVIGIPYSVLLLTFALGCSVTAFVINTFGAEARRLRAEKAATQERVSQLRQVSSFPVRQAAELMEEFSFPHDKGGSAKSTFFFKLDAACKASTCPGATKIGEGKNAVYEIDRDGFRKFCEDNGYQVPEFLK